MGDLDDIDLDKLSPNVRNKLAQLELELSEGFITEKGYNKKREQLLKQYSNVKNPPTKHKSRHNRRTTRTESRYHSEVRQEAVQQALSKWTKDSFGPKPMKRRPSIANGNSNENKNRSGMFKFKECNSGCDQNFLLTTRIPIKNSI
jgi:hypothetical protein